MAKASTQANPNFAFIKYSDEYTIERTARTILGQKTPALELLACHLIFTLISRHLFLKGQGDSLFG